MIRKNEIPAFRSEAEEAAWWDAHPEETAARMRQATLAEVLSKKRDAERRGPVPVAIDGEDLERARRLAEKQGMSCQSYVRKLVRKALDREASKLRVEAPLNG